MLTGCKFFPYGYRFIELFSKNPKQVSIIRDKIVNLQFTLSHKGSVVTWLDFILYVLFILVYSLELNFFKFLWRKVIIFALNTKYQKYRVRLICPLLKKSNKCSRKAKSHSPPMLYYSCCQTFNKLWVI